MHSDTAEHSLARVFVEMVQSGELEGCSLPGMLAEWFEMLITVTRTYPRVSNEQIIRTALRRMELDSTRIDSLAPGQGEHTVKPFDLQ